MRIRLIHKDRRGQIYKFNFKNQEYILLFTNKGYSRGGDYHQSTQYDVVLEGKIEWKERFDGVAESTSILKKGESNIVSSGVPHMITALEDSVVLEWLQGDFEKQYFKPYRKIIEEKLR